MTDGPTIPIRFIGRDDDPRQVGVGHVRGVSPCLGCTEPGHPKVHGCQSRHALLHGVRDASGRWIWERCDACGFGQRRAP